MVAQTSRKSPASFIQAKYDAKSDRMIPIEENIDDWVGSRSQVNSSTIRLLLQKWIKSSLTVKSISMLLSLCQIINYLLQSVVADKMALRAAHWQGLQNWHQSAGWFEAMEEAGELGGFLRKQKNLQQLKVPQKQNLWKVSWGSRLKEGKEWQKQENPFTKISGF